MQRFIALVDFTPKGLAAIGDTVERSDAFRDTAAAMGAKVHEVYWTLGAHDGVLIFDAETTQAATALVLKLAGAGNVQTKTLRALTRDEMLEVLGRLD